MWVEKYRPTKISRLVGNEEEHKEVFQWLKSWKKGKKPVLLSGPPGTGKTTLVRILAKMLDYSLIELNASDIRTKKMLEDRLGSLQKNLPLYPEKFLIFFDEVDGIYGRADYGGLDFINNFVKDSRYPIIMAANNEDSEVVKKLEKKSKVFKIRPLTYREVEAYLKDVLEREKTSIKQEIIENIIRQTRGDLRAALNSLQSLIFVKSEKADITRDVQLSLRESIILLYNSETKVEALKALRYCKEHNTMQKLQSIYKSVVSSNLDIDERSLILSSLSELDVLSFQTEIKGEYRLRKYFDVLLVNSIFDFRKKLMFKEFADLSWSILQKLFRREPLIRKSIYDKIAKHVFASSNKVTVYYFPYFIEFYKKDKELIHRVIRLDENEINLLQKLK